MSALLEVDDIIVADDDLKIGALADGLAASAINSTDIDDNSTGYVGGLGNGDNRNNETEIKTETDIDTDIETNDNGNNRDNEYDWSYESKVETDIDTEIKTETDIHTEANDNGNNRDNEYDWSYESKVETDIDTDIKTITETEIKTETTTTTEANDNGNNRDNVHKSDDDFAKLEDVKDFGNLGIAGGDIAFNLGDDFSFNLDVDHLLNGSLTGAGNDTGFSVVQANNLADQDNAYNMQMFNQKADNNLKADGGHANGGDGIDVNGKEDWDLGAGDDLSGSSLADASAILANSGFHQELVQGANLVSNAVDISVIGGHSTVNDVGEDTGA